MNREYKRKDLGYCKLPFMIDSFKGNKEDGYYIEYDGWHFEAKSIKAVINKVLRYIFVGGEK